MNYYMNVGNRFPDMLSRSLYQEIGMVEEEHVTHYESLNDPAESWFEMWVMHEYNECYLYHSLMNQEPDSYIKGIWEKLLYEEIEHLRIACEMMKKHENRDPAEVLLPAQLPEPVIFQSNIDYIREILATQTDYTEYEMQFLPLDQVADKSRFQMYQDAVNDGMGFIPSQRVIENNIRDNRQDYRLEAKGPHPLKRFQTREKVTV
jgi:hypothetical protein